MHEKTNTMHACTPRVTIHLLPSKIGHGMHVKYFGKTKTKQKIIVPRWRFRKFPIKMIVVPSSKIAKNTWHHCIHGPYDDPRPSRTNFLNARLSTKFNGGTKLLKGVENIEKTFEYNAINLQKRFPSFFKKTTSHNTFKTNSQNIEISFQKDTHLCIYSNKNNYKGCLDKASFSKHFQKPHTPSTISNNWKAKASDLNK